MKNIIDYDSLNIYSGPSSLHKFFGSDAPGALSWLNVEAHDLDIDVPPFKEVELSSVVPPSAVATLNKQGTVENLEAVKTFL